MSKGPRILEIRSWGDGTEWAVRITMHQFNKIPTWVRSHIYWQYDAYNIKHCEFIIEARDPLEAGMRFKKLWAGLPRKKED